LHITKCEYIKLFILQNEAAGH